MVNVKHILAGATVVGLPFGLSLLAKALSPKKKRSSSSLSKKITVITPTSRTEDFTNFPKFQKIASKIRKGENPKLANDDDPAFKPHLVQCVKDNQRTFLQATAESLELQTFSKEDFEWVIVDVWAEERRKYTEGCYSFAIKHVKEKPSIWHGLKEPEGWESETKPPFPTVCNARNTGIIVADGELLIYADDTVLFTPKFLEVAWHWYERGYALKGYRHKFREDLSIDREFENFWLRGGAKRYALSHIWGHILAVPLEWELEINGWEEFLDGAIGAEDIEHGFRLQKSYGPRCVLDQRVLVYELGGFHIHVGRPHVRSNALLLEHLYGKDCANVPKRGNVWRPRREAIDGYIRCFKEVYAKGGVGEMKAGMGDAPHPFVYKACDTPTFDLRDLREKYHCGEFRW